MDFVKRQLFMIICGVVAAGSIALGVVGFTSMSEVDKQMTEAAMLSQRFTRLGSGGRGGPINEKTIAAQRRRIDAVGSYYEQVLESAHRRNRQEPLLPESFPDPVRDQKIAFREAYFAKFDQFLEKLHAGTVATAEEIAEASVQIEERKKAYRTFGIIQDEAGGQPQAGAEEEEEEKPRQYPSGLLTDYGANEIPEARANLIKARGFRCYATRGAFETLAAVGRGIAPEVVDMWDAQVSLWVQESVVDALARINDRAAEEARQAGQRPWVGLMPIKELVSIRTSPYVIEASETRDPASPGADGPAHPPGSANEVFTHTVSNDLYEVVQFTVKMVVDARMIPTIVDEICKDNFHTLLRMAYQDKSTDPSLLLMTDKIYGSDPTVRLVMDFETVFFGELYRSLMPDEVRDALGLPPREE